MEAVPVSAVVEGPWSPSPTSLAARRFLADLREEIRLHPAVNHIFLNRVATMPFTKEDFKVFGLQHFPLVNCFTHYMENLLISAPDSRAKQWLAKVLVDEYGEGTDGDDHTTLYASYLRAAGATDEEMRSTVLGPGTIDFIKTHIELTTRRPFLVGLGAIGPGHEWAIPTMFDAVVPGLRRAGFEEWDIRYFWVHQSQDQDHGSWLEEALALYAGDELARRQIREGALLSLDARERFWTSVQDEVVRWRQPRSQKVLARRVRSGLNGALRELAGRASSRPAAAWTLTRLRRALVPVQLDDVLPVSRLR